MSPTPEQDVQAAMTAAELSLFRSFISHSKKYVEFGCGGSTVIAAETEKDWILSTDTSHQWTDKVRSKCINSTTRPELLFVDLGPTGSWGRPTDISSKPKWPQYHEMIWSDPRASHADFYLVDGRFRVACTIQCLLRCQPGAFIAIHDFNDRPHYHAVKQFLREVASAEQLSIFVRKNEIDIAKAIEVLAEHRFIPD